MNFIESTKIRSYIFLKGGVGGEDGWKFINMDRHYKCNGSGRTTESEGAKTIKCRTMDRSFTTSYWCSLYYLTESLKYQKQLCNS